MAGKAQNIKACSLFKLHHGFIAKRRGICRYTYNLQL